jgi:hypothetical protein
MQPALDRTLELTRTRAELSAAAAGLPAPSGPMFAALAGHKAAAKAEVAAEAK